MKDRTESESEVKIRSYSLSHTPPIVRPEGEPSLSQEKVLVLKRGIVFAGLYMVGLGLLMALLWGLGVFRIFGL